MITKNIGFRCPEDLAKEIEEKEARTGRSKTDIILELIKGLPSTEIHQRKTLPKQEAVYLVWTNHRLLYIGQTTNLCQKILNHHRLVEFLNCEAKIAWFDSAGCDRLEVESSLIDILSPELNGLRGASTDKRIQVLIPEDLWKQYRLYCFEHDTNMSDDIRKYVIELIKRSRESNGNAL